MDDRENAAPVSGPAWVELLHAEVAWVLDQAGVDAILIKGLSTSRWLYSLPGRQSVDVDVLVAPSRVTEALAALAARGFRDVNEGTRPGEVAPHSLVLQRTDPALGGHELDLHRTLPGAEADPDAVWDVVWARRLRDGVAGVAVWFPDLPARALLVANQAARDGAAGAKSRRDLAAALAALPDEEWAEAAALARSAGMAESMRVALESLPEGADLAARLLGDIEVSEQWRLSMAGSSPTAHRLSTLEEVPWARRPALVARWIFPSRAFMRQRLPLARRGRRGLAAAYVVRLGEGVRSLPAGFRELRSVRRGR